LLREDPYVCRDVPGFVCHFPLQQETPPRMWGRVTAIRGTAPNLGNTPTHVGTSALTGESVWPLWKHPHACGDEPFVSIPASRKLETPPRMWGRVFIRPDYAANFGNTPTHVGTRSAPGAIRLTGQKHPHACGDE